MAETRKASVVPVSPRRPPVPHTHAVRGAAPLRLSYDEPKPRAPREPEPTVQGAPPESRGEAPRDLAPPRAPAEKFLRAMLLVSLGLTGAAFLMSDAEELLTRADALFAAAVLLSGGALLALAELCRRGGGSASR